MMRGLDPVLIWDASSRNVTSLTQWIWSRWTSARVSAWADGSVDPSSVLSRFELTAAEAVRLRECRRLMAVYWLLALLPGSPGQARNPLGTLELQAERLLALLG